MTGEAHPGPLPSPLKRPGVLPVNAKHCRLCWCGRANKNRNGGNEVLTPNTPNRKGLADLLRPHKTGIIPGVGFPFSLGNGKQSGGKQHAKDIK